MKASGLKINNMAKVRRSGQTMLTTLEATSTARSKAEATSTGRMDLLT